MKIENVIYIITNPQYPGYIKIGYASDLKQRLSSLNTGALIEFEPYAVYETPKENGDIEIHKIIKLLNPILRASKFDESKVKLKEFFKIEPEEAFELLEHIAVVSGTRHKLYKIDKGFNKIVEDAIKIPPSIKDANIITRTDNTLPDGTYYYQRKIKSLNKVFKGKLEVKNGRFFLKAGSDIAPESERYEGNKRYYNGLKIENNTLMQDAEFKSVSISATVICGKNSNGWDDWKDSDGNPIKIYRKNNQ